MKAVQPLHGLSLLSDSFTAGAGLAITEAPTGLTLSVTFGTAAGTVTKGDDKRLFADAGADGIFTTQRVGFASAPSPHASNIAVFGGLAQWPQDSGCCWNTYYDGGFKAVVDGYGAYFNLSSATGNFELWSTSTSVLADQPQTMTQKMFMTPAGDVAFPGNMIASMAISSLGGWTAPTLLASWVDLDATHPSGYEIRIDGTVRIRGTITGGTILAGTVLFTLPLGLRPLTDHRFAVACSGGYAALEILTNGNVVILVCPANGYLALDGMDFPIV